MKTKPRASRKHKPYGPNIVRAWFDTVFHFALQGLATERNYLDRRNWTFSSQNRRLEYLAPLAQHLPGAARENLEQFVSFFPEAATLIREHDRRESELEQRCRIYFDAIVDSPPFQEVLRDVAADALQTTGRPFSEHFGAYSAETDFMGILAEYLVNNIEALPNHYSTAELWNEYRERFQRILATPGLLSFRRATEESGTAMLAAVDDLITGLKSIRSRLSLEFDVPYVAELASVR